MNVVIFDTETTSLEKPFCYNIGAIGFNTETGEKLFSHEWVIEQIWHNSELFSSAYYADKRPIYIDRMRARKIKMDKFGYVTQALYRLYKEFEIVGGYAYNAPFDEKVFNFNCEWFKCINPFDNVPIFDIRGYVHQFLAFSKEYQAFCEKYSLFTESGNYSTTAESVFKFFDNADFVEEHTALADSEIELKILQNCVERGAEWQTVYKTYQSIPRKIKKTLTIESKRTGETKDFEFEKMRWGNSKTKLILT